MRLPAVLPMIWMVSTIWAAPDAKVFDRKPGKTRKFDRIQYFPQKGRDVSFGGDRLKWTGEGDCSQNEAMEPIISVQGEGVTVRNAWIDGAPDGIHVSAPNVVIENIVFPKVCEDAITANSGADNLVIRNCAFRGARDKAIQLNAGKNIVIENCLFEDCAKPVRVKSGVTVTVRNNVSTGSTVFILADGEGARALAESNDVRKSKWFAKAEKKARIVIGKGNRLSRIERKNEANSGGVIESR
jgi:Pectate lyase.